MLAAPLASAAEPRAAFHASKRWLDFTSAGVVVREQWVPVEGTALTLVHAVRTSPAVPKFEAALFALESVSGDEWAGAVETSSCPPLETVKSLTALYRQGGVVVVRLGQREPLRKPFADCGALYRASDLAACTLRVPLKLEAPGIVSGPDQVQYGPGWISVSRGRVDVQRSPHAGLKLTSALRECLGDEVPVVALLEDRLAIAGARHLLRVSPELTAVCAPCLEAGLPLPTAMLKPDELRRRARAALEAWRGGRREQALAGWGELYAAYWAGDRVPAPAWVDTLTEHGAALAAVQQWDQARQVLEEAWTMSKAPSVELLLAMGDAYRGLNELDAAVRAYEHVLELAPTRAQRERAQAALAELRPP